MESLFNFLSKFMTSSAFLLLNLLVINIFTMKKFIFTLVLLTISLFTFAQSNFENKITENVSKLKSAKTTNDYENLYNEFSNLTQVNTPNIWKAYYYAGLTKYSEVDASLKAGKLTGLDENNAIAYKYTMAAFYTQKQNTDIQKLLKLIELQKKMITDGNIFTKR